MDRPIELHKHQKSERRPAEVSAARLQHVVQMIVVLTAPCQDHSVPQRVGLREDRMVLGAVRELLRRDDVIVRCDDHDDACSRSWHEVVEGERQAVRIGDADVDVAEVASW